AAFMAYAWGRLTGQAGVCLATLGPGATNLTTGLADANLDRAPVVAITGQLARGLLHKESHQYVESWRRSGPSRSGTPRSRPPRWSPRASGRHSRAPRGG